MHQYLLVSLPPGLLYGHQMSEGFRARNPPACLVSTLVYNNCGFRRSSDDLMVITSSFRADMLPKYVYLAQNAYECEPFPVRSNACHLTC